MTSLPFSTAAGSDVRVRFCPSPTGTPHVGLIRTALFNWAWARRTGGRLIFRIEDTDAARDSEESYHQLIEALRWLRIDWDEGVETGGPHEPYRQSQRRAIYDEVLAKLIAAGHVYESYSSPEEIEARNLAAGRPTQLGYDNFDRDLSEAQRAAYRAEGRQPALRLRVPDEVALGFDDLVRGPIEFAAGSTIDYVLVRPNGDPLYTFVNPVDDALMGVTHVLRGEDLLSSTPRQIALFLALIDIGVASAIPLFGHLPYVMGEGNKKLSKRDPESNLFHLRDQGFIAEGLTNYLALLGWSLSPDRDVFSMAELAAAFEVTAVNGNPARFDLKKATAINGDQLRALEPADFAARLVPYLAGAGLVADPPAADQAELLAAAAPLVQERMNLLGEAPGLLGFLFTTAEALEVDPEAVAALAADAPAVVAAARTALAALEAGQWGAVAIQAALEAALIGPAEDGGLGLKPRVAYGPVRVAISGRRVSPPLFESLELLGRRESLARLDRFAGLLGAAG